jgi:hypothetical protein
LSDDKRDCVEKKCANDDEWVDKDGKCAKCEKFTRKAKDGKSCIYTVCTDFELP